MLLDQGAKPNEVDNDGRIALIQASQEGHLEVVECLVQASSNVNHRAHDGKTSLRVAAVEGHAQVVEYLLTSGADINYVDADGRTTLYVLALDGNVPMTRLLLAHGAMVEAVDVEGRTALHVASWQGNAQVVKALVRHGAKVNSEDNDRRTAVQSASWQGHDDVVRLLLEAGASPDHTCNQGATALCIAAQEGHEDVVRTLLAFRANPNHADQFGRTPYRVALKSGHHRVCKILEDFGAIVPTGAKSRSNSSSASSGLGGVAGTGGGSEGGKVVSNGKTRGEKGGEVESKLSASQVSSNQPASLDSAVTSSKGLSQPSSSHKQEVGVVSSTDTNSQNVGVKNPYASSDKSSAINGLAHPSASTAVSAATSTIMALAASPESSTDRRKSYLSSKSSSTKSFSDMTTSTNKSGAGTSGGGNLSRLDRECLTFTQQLQQCSMGKNRSRPISRVLSPVSEPQSPETVRSPGSSSNHPAAPPIPRNPPPMFTNSAASRLGPGADSNDGYCEIHTGLGVQIISSARRTNATARDIPPANAPEDNKNNLSPLPPPLPPKGPGLSLNRCKHSGLSSISSSSAAHHPSSSSSLTGKTTTSSCVQKPERRTSTTINIITNPHADMMSSVEEPVWQKNPAHPVNNGSTNTSNNSSNNISNSPLSSSNNPPSSCNNPPSSSNNPPSSSNNPPSNGCYRPNYHNHYVQKYHRQHSNTPPCNGGTATNTESGTTNGLSAFTTTCSSSSSSSSSHLDVGVHNLHPHHPSTSSSPSRIIMGQSSLSNKSPERRWKRNGIVTNPKAMLTSASSTNTKSMSSSNSSSNSISQHHSLTPSHRHQNDARHNMTATTTADLVSPTSPSCNGHSIRASFSPTTSPTNGGAFDFRDRNGYLGSSPQPCNTGGKWASMSTQPALYELDGGQQCSVKPVRPNGLPIKKVNSPRPVYQ